MKTKYIKVSVSYRTPETAGYYFIINRATGKQIGYFNGRSFAESFIDPEYWLDEVPDYEEEILELMKKLDTELDFQYKHREMTGGLYECWDELKTLLTKLKTES